MNHGEEPLLSCPLCGNRFAAKEQACGGCPLGKNCRRLCCPRCRYEFIEESGTVNWLKKFWSGRKSRKEARG
jgi:hypothetical protein